MVHLQKVSTQQHNKPLPHNVAFNNVVNARNGWSAWDYVAHCALHLVFLQENFSGILLSHLLLALYISQEGPY